MKKQVPYYRRHIKAPEKGAIKLGPGGLFLSPKWVALSGFIILPAWMYTKLGTITHMEGTAYGTKDLQRLPLLQTGGSLEGIRQSLHKDIDDVIDGIVLFESKIKEW